MVASNQHGDLIHQTTTTSGTGNKTLVAVPGKRSLDDEFSTGGTDRFDVFMFHRTEAEWEHSTGHMDDATTLVIDTVVASSNSDSAVDFTAGTIDVTNDVPAANAVNTHLAQTITGQKTFVAPVLGTVAAGSILTNATGLPTAGLVDAAVTYAKMQNVVADERLLGRVSGADGDVEELTQGQALTMLGVEAGATADQSGAEIKSAYEAEANAYTDTKNTKLSGISDNADVTGTSNVQSAGALMDSEVDADIKTLVLPASTTISAFGRTLIDDAAASNARTTLDAEQADADILKADTNDILFAGYGADTDDDGDFASSTYTAAYTGGNVKHIRATGTGVTIAVPAVDSTIIVLVRNTAAATFVTSAWTIVTGTLTVAINEEMLLFMTRTTSDEPATYSHLHAVPLQ